MFAIAMSGFGTNADRAKSKTAGYRYHILKPFDPGILDDILEEAAREMANAGARLPRLTHTRDVVHWIDSQVRD